MKKVSYDKYYQEEQYFGNPYPGLVEFFKNFESRGHVLDLGCGQGRDSLFLAQLGYDVTGVDHSQVGINQMIASALEHGVDLKGVVADVYTYTIDATVDLVLLDSMVHFYQKDKVKETAFVTHILNGLKDKGIFVNLILKGDQRENVLKKIITSHADIWEVLHESYVAYPEADCLYHLLVVQKTDGV